MTGVVDAQREAPQQNGLGGGSDSAQPAGNGKKKKRWLWIVIEIGAVVGGGYILHWYLWSLTHEDTDDAQVAGHIHPIAAQVPGYVAEVCIRDNQLVAANDVLIRIQDSDYVSRVNQAEAQLAEAQASVKVAMDDVVVLRGTTSAAIAQAEAGVAQAEASLKAAQATAGAAEGRLTAAKAAREEAASQIDSAKANLDLADFEVHRLDRLSKEDAAAKFEMTVATTGHQRAKAGLAAAMQQAQAAKANVSASTDAVAAAKASVVAAQADVAVQKAKLAEAQTGPDQVRVAESKVQLARAQAQAAEAQLKFARLQLGYCTIRTPVSGVVSKRSVEAGQYLSPGLTVLAIVPLSDTWVLANFKETQLKDIRPNQPALLRVDAYPDRPFEGVIDSISAGTGASFSILPPENATGNFVKIVQRVPVKIVLKEGQRDPERPLRVGMNVVVTVDTDQHPATSSQ